MTFELPKEPLHIHAFIMKSEDDPPEYGMRVELYPMPEEISRLLMPELRDFVAAWMVENGLMDLDAILINVALEKKQT